MPAQHSRTGTGHAPGRDRGGPACGPPAGPRPGAPPASRDADHVGGGRTRRDADGAGPESGRPDTGAMEDRMGDGAIAYAIPDETMYQTRVAPG